MIRLKHETCNKIQNSLHCHIEIQYGAKQQYVNNEEVLSPPLNKEETKYVQALAGVLLYYAIAVDSTILPALSSLSTKRAKSMQKTIEKIKQLLDYCATQEEAIITYLASKMILCIHSDAGYCNEKNAQSQAGAHFSCRMTIIFPPQQHAILMNATNIQAFMSSAAEAELGALFFNAKEAVYLCQILTEMGHQQPQTPIQTNNTTAEGAINNTIQPKCTKAMDMHFNWLRDQEAQSQFKIYWQPGRTNLADYFTKHHPPA